MPEVWQILLVVLNLTTGMVAEQTKLDDVYDSEDECVRVAVDLVSQTRHGTLVTCVKLEKGSEK